MPDKKRIDDEIAYAKHIYSHEKFAGFLMGLVAAEAITGEEMDAIISADHELKDTIYPKLTSL